MHKSRQSLICHYCDHREPMPKDCPLCQQKSLVPIGLGTEKLLEQLQLRFPEARIERLDRDTAGSLTRVLSAMHRHELDILIGTRCWPKGMTFQGDAGWGGACRYRDGTAGLSCRRADVSALSQVAGRAGRASRPGQVLIQTYNPEHPAVSCAAQHDYLSFAEAELEARLALSYPPSVRLGLLRIDGEDPTKSRRWPKSCTTSCRRSWRRNPMGRLCSVPRRHRCQSSKAAAAGS